LAIKQVNLPSHSKLAQEKMDMEHIQCLINELPSELMSKKREQAIEFTRCNANAFYRS